MPKFINALHEWNTDAFAQVLKNEIVNLKTGTLPLDKGVYQGGFADDSNLDATVLCVDADEIFIHAKVGIFFHEIVISYCCGDEEPMINNAYCELKVSIDKISAETEFILVS